MKEYIILALIYFIIISLISVIVAVKDKSSAIKSRRRTPEKTLMLLGLFGGAAAMYITMKIIRHKTKHMKFMIGLPLEIALQIIVIVLLCTKLI